MRVEAHNDPSHITEPPPVPIDTYQILLHLFSPTSFYVTIKMIRYFVSRHLDCREVMLMCMVSKEIYDIMFAKNNYKGMDFYNFIHPFTVKCPRFRGKKFN